MGVTFGTVKNSLGYEDYLSIIYGKIIEIMMSENFLGSGFAFPFDVDETGSIAQSSHEKSIAESIKIILGTSKGERLMRPDFGCEVNDLVFAPNNSRTRTLVSHYIENALVRWEPRIILDKVEALTDPDDETKINVSIHYKIRSINTYFNMVYPFYLERGELDTQSQFR
ncbi:GPW/gp25 family protein [Spirochaeta cellobiosiphila]|uniref:GPW/gp25 family protein n=1 Tax=Spirochaeta cellobiosiphila TaxID=504483 RepID=UPI00040895EC|nr:GPW/gp25 family protein [Spirochaeta cellobiosiphila]